MKKEWTMPAIEELDLSSTAYQTLEGTNVDGQWLDVADCQMKDAYYLS